MQKEKARGRTLGTNKSVFNNSEHSQSIIDDFDNASQGTDIRSKKLTSAIDEKQLTKLHTLQHNFLAETRFYHVLKIVLQQIY